MLGFGFNKAKVLASAEKSVKQGKLPNAIADYEKIAKEDPTDLNVLNTIGDLYTRLGNSEKATAYFQQVGNAYAGDGFTVKAIAMYKKLSKHHPGHTESMLKLAELYALQGLNNDARMQYTMLAEQFVHAADHQRAAGMFQKILELDPENTQIQSRLADTYANLGKTAEARDLYFRAAQTLRIRGALEPCDHALGQALGVDEGFSPALMLRGQVRLERGNAEGAAACLEALPDLDSRPEALRLLLAAQLRQGKRAEAEPVARKLLSIFGDSSGIGTYAEALIAAGDYRAALDFYREHAAKLFAADTPATLAALQKTVGPLKEDSHALQILRDLFAASGHSSHSAEVTELLAHAWVKEGELEKARDLYRKLVAAEPENPTHAQNYRQVVSRLGGDSTAGLEDGAEGASAWADDWEPAAPPIEQPYSPEVANEIRNAITESELYAAYNSPAKALPLLEAVLPRAPHDVALNQRLLSLYTRLGRLAEAAQRCQVLSSVYAQAKAPGPAQHYADLARRYRDQGVLPTESESLEATLSGSPDSAPLELEVVETSEDNVPDEPVVTPVSGAGAASGAEEKAGGESGESAHEIDLSEEWERVLSADRHAETPAAAAASDSASSPPAAMTAELGDLVEEIRFYLSQGMGNEARTALARAEAIAADSPLIAEMREQVAAAAPVSPDLSGIGNQETVMPPDPAQAPLPREGEQRDREAAEVLGGLVLDLEDSLGQDFSFAPAAAEPPTSPAPVANAMQPSAGPPAAPAETTAGAPGVSLPPAMAAPGSLATRAIDISLRPQPEPAPATLLGQGDDGTASLAGIFAEFKREVESSSGEHDDPETHYNLGMAFKEMGLLDEAIGELQKVCKAIESGHAFRQVIEAYTWLAHCFIEKAIPEAGIYWYEKALELRGLSDEHALAIRYELACAQETAGDLASARRHFMSVLSANIDYRDVAQRIQALKP